MVKKYCFQVLALLLVTHGTIFSMMHSRKLLRGRGNVTVSSRLNSNSIKKIDSFEKIAQSLENIEIKLEEQNELLQNLQRDFIEKQQIDSRYALRIAKTEAMCKVYAAKLTAPERGWALHDVNSMFEE